MKTLQALLISCALVAPSLAFARADNNAPVTRAEAHTDLSQVEQAGYRPVASDESYPSNIEAAEAKVAEQANSPAAQPAVGGGTMTRASQLGTAIAVNDAGSLFAHH
ncbi:hypothetical protein BZM27_45905 [Paraburkholderia steynii]|uniref:Purine-nucleoside phosphorylase n=1 Tax=Paraburkholderia steynii TaxID=1245441 RepID=A0A4R0X5S0_9BURK|nr:hypothetical protein BZM27_45905 [Paraburkholderia steynii]